MKNKKLLSLIASIAVFFILYVLVGRPDYLTPQSRATLQLKACGTDLATFCKTNPSGSELNCLIQNEGRLSSDCRPIIQKVLSFRGGCAEDMAKFCPDTERDFSKTGVSLLDCLKSHSSQLTPQCSNSL